MTAADKKKSLVLGALLVVAGLTWFFVYRTDKTAAPKTATAASRTKVVRPINDAKIRIELIEGAESAEVGQKNIFQYRQKPVAAAPPPAPPAPVVTPRPNPAPTVVVNSNPQPPFPAFRYEGFTMNPPKSGQLLASLTLSGNTYTVRMGECLMGQYCVRQLSETTIEIEDIQLKQRRPFTRTLQ